MFQVKRPSNRLVRLEERRFSELGLREREHLQDALSEPLVRVEPTDRVIDWPAT